LRAVSIDGSGPLVTQVPALQSCPDAHARPHAPQCATEVARSLSQPLEMLPSQSPYPVAHAKVQVPALHAALVFGAPTPAHARPHAPQFVALPSRLTSQPLVALLSQSAKPAAHEIAQTPIAQRAMPFAELHARPHAPQDVAVALRSVSQPLPALPSQSP
jgi:hypothetical protein